MVTIIKNISNNIFRAGIFSALLFSTILKAEDTTDPGSVGIDQKKFDKCINWVFTDTKKTKTETLLVLKDDKLIYEKYLIKNQETKHLLWSISKSITALLFGIAEQKGFVHRTHYISKYIKVPKSMGEIRVLDLLHMSSGLDWKEYYDKSPFNSHIVAMLYMHYADMTSHVLRTPVKYKPGERFYYSSGDTMLLNAVLKAAIPKDEYNDHPWEWLYKPLGIKDAIFEQDGKGVFVGPSYAYLNFRDLAKIGQLILDKGMYQGKKLINKDFINFMQTLAPAINNGCYKKTSKTYGGHVWLNRKCPGVKHAPFPNAPEDTVMFFGHYGQSVFIFPSQNMIAVRGAQDVGNAFDRNAYAKCLVGSVK